MTVSGCRKPRNTEMVAPFSLGRAGSTAKKHLSKQAWLHLFLSAPSPAPTPLNINVLFLRNLLCAFLENYIRKQKMLCSTHPRNKQGQNFLKFMFLSVLDCDVASCSGSNLDFLVAWNLEL